MLHRQEWGLQVGPVSERLCKPFAYPAPGFHDAREGLEIDAILAIDGLWQDMDHSQQGRGGSNDDPVDAFGNQEAIIAEQRNDVAELARTVAVLKEKVVTLEDRIQELRKSQNEERERRLYLEVEVLKRLSETRFQTR